MSEISKESIAGVWPAESGEALIHEVSPSVANYGIARILGGFYGMPFPVGLAIAAATHPLPALLFFVNRFRRYTITTTRVRRTGIMRRGGQEVLLADLEDVRIVQRAGQRFYQAADLELIVRGQVALTLPAVSHPETFRHNILEARDAYVQVAQCRKAEEQQLAAAAT